MRLRFKATHVVLAMLCVMYFITYVDRVNIGTAASEIQKELGLSNTQLGLVFSAFAYPYLLFQVVGGWVGDRFGPRKTLFWCGMIWAAATIMTGFVTSLLTLFIARVALGFGEGATFPTATRAMQYWTPETKRGFAQGLTHAFARLGNAVTPPLIAALIVWLTWRGSFIALGLVSLVWGVIWALYFPQRTQGSSRDHRGRAGLASATPGQYAPSGTMGAAVAADVARHTHLLLLWLVPVAIPELAAVILQEQLQSGRQEFGAVRLGRLLCRRRRRQPGRNPL
jgi:MFS family permease